MRCLTNNVAIFLCPQITTTTKRSHHLQATIISRDEKQASRRKIQTTLSASSGSVGVLNFGATPWAMPGSCVCSGVRKMATASSACEKLISVGTKIIGVGRNYAAHAKELGNAVPKEPVLFLKPTSSYLANGGTIEIPKLLESLHHEVELAVVIGQRARDVPQASAMDYVGGYALALDMTAREIQSAAKSAGLPWTVAKGQDTFTPISPVLPRSMVPDPDNLELWLKVNGEIRQKGSTKDMIFKIPYLISHISSIMTLLEGDVILTGTPEGVGPVKVGQKIDAGITGLVDVHFNVGRRTTATS